MEEYTIPDVFETGVIVTCTDDKYIGYLLGSDDIYLYLRYTHKAKAVYPVATVESVKNVARVVAKRPLWVLRLEAAKKFKVNTLKMSRDEIALKLASQLVDDVIAANGPVETYIAQPQSIKVALPHTEILNFESLSDKTTSAILTGLDFTAGSAYNEEHDNGTATT